MSSAEIRPVVAADFDVWLPLWKGYQDFYRVDIADAVTRNTWARFLDPADAQVLDAALARPRPLLQDVAEDLARRMR